MFIIVMQVYAEKELSCEGMEGIVLTQCEKAMKGDLEAMYNLGAMYQGKGKLGEEPNYEKAITWLKKAAEGGNAAAMINLGLIYGYGIGQPDNKPNDEESFKWYQAAFEVNNKAADDGDVQAMNDLGGMYYNGEGQPGNRPNYQEALKWYKMAAEGGYREAMFNVGLMYYKGEGQPGNRPNYQEALTWLTKAAEEGHVDAMYNLGLMYYKGENQPENKPNYKEAFKWFKMAAEGGQVKAMFNVGVMYAKGEGQLGNKPNDEKAIEWWTKAAGRHDKRAQKQLERIQKISRSADPDTGGKGTTAGVECDCEENKEISYYFNSEELDDLDLLREDYGDDLIEDGGYYYIESKFSYWADNEEMYVFPDKFCQIPEVTVMVDLSYKDGGTKEFYDYYDYNVNFWSDDLLEEYIYAACDERE